MIQKEKKNTRIAYSLSITFHVIVALIALFFVGCWKAPGPPWPNPEVGFEIDFGTDDLGSGDVKTEATPSDNEETDVVEETTEPTEEVTEPTEATEQTTETTPTEPVETPTETTPVTETNVTPVVENSDVAVENNTTNSQETNTTTEETPTPTDVIQPNTTPTETSQNQTTGNNNGDDVNQVGDKGVEDSPKAIDKYEGEKSGSGEQGASLSITGWMWEKAPTEENITKQGQIVFDFVVDEYGSVISHEIVSSTYLPEQNKLLVKKLYQVRFRQTSAGRPPEYTKGRLVWKFKAK